MRSPLRILFILLAVAAPVFACNVPVFRFALERWNPDAYEVFVFHRGELSAADAKIVELIEKQITGKQRKLDSFYLNTVDVTEEMDDRTKAVLAAARIESYPSIVVRFPRAAENDEPAFSGPLNRSNAESIAQSPVRRALIDKLVEGESVVWLLVESGDKAKDDAAADLLKDELARHGKEMTLPELDVSDDQYLNPDTKPLIRLSFAMLRVKRDDSREAVFLKMLEHRDANVTEIDGPMAYAIFGRGRVMPPLHGKYLNAGFIEDACRFLIGRCSCQVKDENPGWDLLMPVDWTEALLSQPTLSVVVPKLTSPEEVLKQNQLITSEAKQALANAGTSPGAVMQVAPRDESLLRNVWIVSGVALALVVAGTVWVRVRR